jgi:hypothetical protein
VPDRLGCCGRPRRRGPLGFPAPGPLGFRTGRDAGTGGKPPGSRALPHRHFGRPRRK